MTDIELCKDLRFDFIKFVSTNDTEKSVGFYMNNLLCLKYYPNKETISIELNFHIGYNEEEWKCIKDITEFAHRSEEHDENEPEQNYKAITLQHK